MQDAGRLLQSQGVQQVVIAGAGMVTACAQHFTLCIQYIDYRTGAHLETGLRGLNGLLVGDYGTLQRADLADAGDDAAVVVARLPFGGAPLLFLFLARLVILVT